MDECKPLDSGHPIMDDPDQLVGEYKSGDSFGELALLYSCPRAATIRAASRCALWTLAGRCSFTLSNAR